MWFDSHNHLQDPRLGDAAACLEAMRGRGIRGCVVNAVREADWEEIGRLAREFPGYVFPAYGIHPWVAHKAAAGWEERLRERLLAEPQASLGECGVDGWVKEPEMDVQRVIFAKHLRIAAELGRPVTIHCLKAWEVLFEMMNEVELWPEKFLMHSFGGSVEVAERLWKKGAYFSLSGYFLQERKAKVVEVFRKIPRDRILLETDAPDMLPPEEHIEFPLENGANHPGNLACIAEEFARRIGVREEELAEQVRENESRFWL